MVQEIKGWHVFAGFAVAFGIIISVNLLLAFKAVQTFPGLEVRNSYVASQSFDLDREAQTALGWDVSAWVADDKLHLQVLKNDRALAPTIENAVFGRATNVSQDQVPEFEFNGRSYVAPVRNEGGNWNLRVKLRAADGTLFQQRIIVRIQK